jgi:N-acetylmuramic acid 6-phosphate etherase
VERVTAIAELSTEARAGGLEDLDRRASADVVRAVAGGHHDVVEAVLAAADAIGALADAAAQRLGRGGRVLYVGAGAAGRTAAVDASEWAPTFGVPEGTVVALLAGAALPPGSAAEAATEDDDAAGAADVAACRPGRDDLCVAISASGRTPYALGALRAAAEAGALTAAVTCCPGSAAAALADLVVEVPVGPEVVAGSSRLKAGTAQKLVLNAFSTAVMVRRGRVLGNLMACMRVSNDKLRGRAVAVLEAATGVDTATAFAALEATGWALDVAVVMLARGVDAGEARACLAAAGGHLPLALGG